MIVVNLDTLLNGHERTKEIQSLLSGVVLPPILCGFVFIKLLNRFI